MPRALAAAVAAVMLSLGLSSTAHAAYGDSTYQWWWKTWSCQYQQDATMMTGQVNAAFSLGAQAVGNSKIRRIRLEAMLAGEDDNGRWVQLDGTKVDLWVDGRTLTGKTTQPVGYRWSHSKTLSNTVPARVAMLYKLSWRRYYGIGPVGVWKTRKKTADFYTPVRMAGNQHLSDVKHYLIGHVCRTTFTNSFRAASAPLGRLALPAPKVEVGPAAPAPDERAAAEPAAAETVATPPARSLAAGAFAGFAAEPAAADRSFEALSAGEAAAAAGTASAPPEPSLAAGPGRLLVAGGGALNVLDSGTGARIGATRSVAAPWTGSGACAREASVAPRAAVLYDEHAARYVAARAIPAAGPGQPALACLAVSAAGDPAGPWNVSSTSLGDGLQVGDVRLAAWPGSYVLTVQDAGAAAGEPADGAATTRTRVIAFARGQALTGAPAAAVVRALPADDGVVDAAPADLDATPATVAGRSALIVASRDSGVALYRLAVDWSDPASATLEPAAPVTGTVTPATDECAAPCAAQPAGGELLDVSPLRVGARPIVLEGDGDGPRLAFGLSGDTASWTTVRDPFGAPAADATADVGMDTDGRAFQPSVAADPAGGLVVAHHGVSDISPAGPRYEAVLPSGEVAGSRTLTPPGAAVQTGGSTFGPDSAAVADADDPCRIWVAGQHARTGVPGDWSVRVAAVRGPGCDAEPDAAPAAAFSATSVAGASPLAVDFDGGASSDPEGGALSYAWTFGDGATATGATPSHTFTGDGLYRVRLVVTDPGGRTGTMTRVVEVADRDEPPVAGTDQLSTKVGETATLDVIAGETIPSDYDPDGGSVAVTGTGDPAHGSVGCAPSGLCTYTPADGYGGADAFTYTLEDEEGNQVTGRVFVEVANREPQLEDDGLVAGSGTPATVDVLDNDRELDPTDSLEFVSSTQPAHGSVDCDAGACTYTSSAGYAGQDRFEYTATDGQAEVTSWVDVIVAPCPDLTNALTGGSNLIASWEWEECASLDAHGETSLSPSGMRPKGPAAVMTSGDAGLAGPPNSSDSTGVDHGSTSRGAYDVSVLRLDLNVPVGATCLGMDAVFASEEYPEFLGDVYNDAFLAQLDGDEWSVADDAITAPGNFAIDSAGRLLSVNSVLFAGVVTANGTEYDGATPPIRIQTPVTPGSHSLYLSIFDASDGILDSAVFLDDLVAGADPAGGCRSGVNAKPVARDDAATTLEDVPVNVNVLLNDSDEDGQLLPGTLRVTTPPSSGAAVVSAGRILYTPAANASGPVSFSYEVCDDGGACATARATVTVTSVNDPPVADFTRTPAGGAPPLAVSFDAGASSDPDSAIAAYEWSFGDGATATGKTAEHVYAGLGVYTAKLTVRDAEGASASTTRTITVGNLPVATDDEAQTDEDTAVEVAVLANDTDADGDDLTVTQAGPPSGGSVQVLAGGRVRFTPPANASGRFTVPYTVSDGHGGTDGAVLAVTVRAVNDAPTAAFSASPVSGVAPLTVAVDASASVDVEGPLASHAWSFGDGAAATGPQASHTYGTPGTYAITLTVTDAQGATATATRTVTVTQPQGSAPQRDRLAVVLKRSAKRAWGTTARLLSGNLTVTRSGGKVTRVAGQGDLPGAGSGRATLTVDVKRKKKGITGSVRLRDGAAKVDRRIPISSIATGKGGRITLKGTATTGSKRKRVTWQISVQLLEDAP